MKAIIDSLAKITNISMDIIMNKAKEHQILHSENSTIRTGIEDESEYLFTPS